MSERGRTTGVLDVIASCPLFDSDGEGRGKD